MDTKGFLTIGQAKPIEVDIIDIELTSEIVHDERGKVLILRPDGGALIKVRVKEFIIDRPAQKETP